MRAGVYIIKNMKNGKVYVGSSADIPTRWSKHRGTLEAGTHHNTKLQRAWLKYGRDVFSFEVVEIEPNYEKRLKAEQKLIDQQNSAVTGYNIYSTAGSPSGYRHSAETIAKISASQKGNKKPAGHGERVSAARKGMAVGADEIARLDAIRPKFHTAESREKMSASRRGNTHRRGFKSSDETRAKQSAALKGRPKSEEARRNIAAAVRRRFGKES